MIITVKGKEMELNFGVRFIREIDKLTERTITVNGYTRPFSEGIAAYIPQLYLENPVAMVDVLSCALWKYKGAFKAVDLEEYIDNLDNDEYNALFADVLEELGNANATKKAALEMKERLKEEAKEEA